MCVYLATGLGIYAVIENPIASVLFSYSQSFLVSQVPVSYTITYRCAWDVDTPAGQQMLNEYKLFGCIWQHLGATTAACMLLPWWHSERESHSTHECHRGWQEYWQ